MNLSELLGQYEQKYLPSTISEARGRSAIKHLGQGIGELEVTALSFQDLVNYRLNRHAAPATVNREFAILGSAYRWAGLEPPRIPRSREIPRAESVDEAAVQKLIDAAHNLQTKAFIALLFATGQRKTAVQMLKRSQIVKGVIEFEADGYEKAHRRKRRARTPITAGIAAILKVLEDAFGKTEYVIPPGAGLPGYCGELCRWFARAAERAGIEVTPHVIRHTAATVGLAKGATVYEVSALLGHSNTQITERVYVHRKPEHIAGTVSKLGRLVKI